MGIQKMAQLKISRPNWAPFDLAHTHTWKQAWPDGRGQTGKFRSTNHFPPELSSFYYQVSIPKYPRTYVPNTLLYNIQSSPLCDWQYPGCWFSSPKYIFSWLRVNGPHNVGDPHNAGLGKWRCKTQSIHLQVDPLLPAFTKTCNEDFPATIFYHSELFRPSRVTIDQI